MFLSEAWRNIMERFLNYGKSWMGIFVQKGDQDGMWSQQHFMGKQLKERQLQDIGNVSDI